MKKTLFTFIAGALILIGIGSLTSCKPKMKDVKGVVTKIDATPLLDTIRSVKVYADGDTLLFNVDSVRYSNGIMQEGDSVEVYYIKGHKDTLLALVLNVKPPKPNVADPALMKNNKLLTR